MEVESGRWVGGSVVGEFNKTQKSLVTKQLVKKIVVL